MVDHHLDKSNFDSVFICLGFINRKYILLYTETDVENNDDN